MLSFLIYITLFIYLLYILWIAEPLFLKRKISAKKDNPNISVIISARNESDNVNSLIKSLKKQTYPNNKFEVIIANDRSTDDTLNKLKELKQDFKNLKIINIEETKINLLKNQKVKLYYKQMQIAYIMKHGLKVWLNHLKTKI